MKETFLQNNIKAVTATFFNQKSLLNIKREDCEEDF